MTEALIFEGNEVRVQADGEGALWWIAADVCAVLGLENPRQALSRLPGDEKGVISNDTLGGPQEMLTVNETGLYRLIFTSRKEEAETFKRQEGEDHACIAVRWT